ncbi:hypothetical protein I4U23_020038 [Adineta vaga]|nr:hypothetical protein I4U23_020038 [Adineta vaga]
MSSPLLLLAGWIAEVVVCFYYVRLLPNPLFRWILVLVPCIILTHLTTHDLPPFSMPSMLLSTFCWFASIRLIHWIVLSPNSYVKFTPFIRKLLWMFLPIVPCPVEYRKQWPLLYDFLLSSVKIILNHWLYRWLLSCPGSDSYARLIMFFTFAVTYTFFSDFLSGIIRLITRDQYMHTTTINFPILAHSLRDFWGRRYNQLVSTVFRESIFQPVRQQLSSSTIASLLVFLVSGLLHVHLAWISVHDSQVALSSLLFFILHGIACTIEAHIPFRLPILVSWFYTQLFLLATASLQIGVFVRAGPDFFPVNAPLFFDQKWLPKLPVPNFCPK